MFPIAKRPTPPANPALLPPLLVPAFAPLSVDFWKIEVGLMPAWNQGQTASDADSKSTFTEWAPYHHIRA
jgi:hypothetical protein